MTQLLVSVKNVEEALLVRDVGADLIDLKDPAVGALGALDINLARQIIERLDKDTPISATVGEEHETVSALVDDIQDYAAIGVDIVKIPLNSFFHSEEIFIEIQRLSKNGIKVVTVFFADQNPTFNQMAMLAQHGFYGVMLDTANKHHTLLDVQTGANLSHFLRLAEQHQMQSGLAGSVDIDSLQVLADLAPSFIGMRGGLCENKQRVSKLSRTRVRDAKSMLLNYNMISI